MSFSRIRRRRALRAYVLQTAREMHRRGLVTGTVGNVSARHGDRMLITPTRRGYRRLRSSEIVELSLDGIRSADCGAEPSIEWRLHAAVYEARPDVGAIVHTHSPYAIARSFDPDPIIVETEERIYLGLDEIHVAQPRPAGSGALAREAVLKLGSRPAVLLARHGTLGTGDTPDAALEMCAAVEHQALIECVLSSRAAGFTGLEAGLRRPALNGGASHVR